MFYQETSADQNGNHFSGGFCGIIAITTNRDVRRFWWLVWRL